MVLPSCTRHRVRARVLLCAVSLLALGPIALPATFNPVSSAQAQQLPNAATQALFLAVDRNDLNAVRDAVNKGADIEARDFTGTQPVDMAIDRGHFEIARYLISVRNLRQNKQTALPEGAPPSGTPELKFSGTAKEETTPSNEEMAQTPQDSPNPFETVAPPQEEAELSAPAPEVPSVIESPIEQAPVQGVPTSEPVMEEVAEVAETPEAVEDIPEPPAAPIEQDAVPTPPTPQPVDLNVEEDPPVQETLMESSEPESEAEAIDPFTRMPEPPTDLPPAAPDVAEINEEPSLNAIEEPNGEDNALSEKVNTPDPLATLSAEPQEPEPETQMAAQPEPTIKPEPEPEPEFELKLEPEAEIQAVREPEPAAPVVEPEAQAVDPSPTTVALDKPSATKQFFTTFMDFFKPPNVTGVTRREDDRKTTRDSVSEEELARQLEEIQAERGDEIIKGPAVPINADEFAQELPLPDATESNGEQLAALSDRGPELPAYSVGSPRSATPLAAQEDAFGDLSIEEGGAQDEEVLGKDAIFQKPDYKEAPGVPGKRYDSTLPYGGGVDPRILALLGLDERTGMTPEELDNLKGESTQVAGATPTEPAPANDDPFAEPSGAEDNPFEPIEGAEADVSTLLDGLDEPKDVAALDAKSAPSRGPAEDDPFAAPPETTGEVDELAGLFEGIGEKVEGTKGWDVTSVEGADLPSEVFVLSDLDPTGEPLDGVELTLGNNVKVGQEVGEERLKLMEQDTIHRPCLTKGGPDTVFCVDKITWPFELEEDFLVDTIMYQGTRAIARYDAGHASHFHTMFRATSFNKVVGYYTERYGQPTQMVERAIAPLAAPRQENPTYLWQSREPGTDTITTLEIRKFDDAQGGGFPDTQRGVILLYRSHAKSIFPQLSQLELMVLKSESDVVGDVNPFSDSTTPGDIWN